MKKVYGVDIDGEVTPLMVRDAMVECFFQAHCTDAELGMEKGSVNKGYCQTIIKKAFTDIGGDFEQPTKESLQKVIGELEKFSTNFRDPEIVKSHAEEIMKLIERL